MSYKFCKNMCRIKSHQSFSKEYYNKFQKRMIIYAYSPLFVSGILSLCNHDLIYLMIGVCSSSVGTCYIELLENIADHKDNECRKHCL